jgi:hypothetical protein
MQLTIYVASDQPVTHPNLAHFVARGAAALMTEWNSPMHLRTADAGNRNKFSSHASAPLSPPMPVPVSVRFWSDVLSLNSSLLGPFGALSGLASSLRSWSGLAGLLEALLLEGSGGTGGNSIDGEEEGKGQQQQLPCFVPTPKSTLSELVLQGMRNTLRQQEDNRKRGRTADALGSPFASASASVPSVSVPSVRSSLFALNSRTLVAARLEHDVSSQLELVPYADDVRPRHFKPPTLTSHGTEEKTSDTRADVNAATEDWWRP